MDIISVALTLVQYSDATYNYYCESGPKTSRSAAVGWRVSRKTISTGDIIYAGVGGFDHPATDLATVAALSYTLGA